MVEMLTYHRRDVDLIREDVKEAVFEYLPQELYCFARYWFAAMERVVPSCGHSHV